MSDSAHCETCFGTGGVPVHAPDCDSDFCVLNGDIHSCNGTWKPCPECEGGFDSEA